MVNISTTNCFYVNHIKGIAFVPNMHSPPPEFLIPHNLIRDIEIDAEPEPEERVIQEQCDLQIVKAILQRSARKWEFMWRGVQISAPVLDDNFYSDFFAHNITIAPGDELRVRLAITQSRDPQTGIYTNVDYRVVEVFEHIPRVKQTSFESHR